LLCAWLEDSQTTLGATGSKGTRRAARHQKEPKIAGRAGYRKHRGSWEA
ncbi:unnamed protein product, partial [Pylaiella littoralis]